MHLPFLKSLGVLTASQRRTLAEEGRHIRDRIQGLGFPRMWGSIPEDILNDVQAWQHKCAEAGLSAAPVYDRLGRDLAHIGSSEVLLVVDQALMALDPPAAVGG